MPGSRSETVTVTDLALEVQRLKQIIHAQSCSQSHKDDQPLFDDPARSEGQSQLTQYGDLEPRADQTVSNASGEVYKGDTLGTLRHGTGRLTCPNGDIYSGRWQYDKRDGVGHAVFERHGSGAEAEQPKPVCYDGEWKDDKTHGEGTCTFEDGAVYSGEWCQDQRSGWGKHVFSNRDWYEGEWGADIMEGQGRLTQTDGSYYECSWHSGQPVKGKWYSADGKTEYEGQFKSMLWHGFGTVHQTGVRKYMGQWKDGLEHGEGQCITTDGATYDGQWKLGCRHGKGKVGRSDGYHYSGDWLDDRPHGQGMCRMSDGSKYVGSWQGGKRHGQGRCLYPSGDQYEGQWEEDERHGKGGCIFASGDKYKGEWRQDKRHGQGVCLFADGTRFRGDWEEDAWVQSAADPSRSRVSGPGLAKALAGQKTCFVIQAYDEKKNRRLSGGDDFKVHLRGPGGVITLASLEDKEDGSYLITYCCNTAGTHDLHITIGEEERVGDSPYSVRVLPGKAIPRQSTVTGPGRMHSSPGQLAQFFIEGRDEYGNRCDGTLLQELPVSVELSCKPFTLPVSVMPTDDGRYLCTYTSDRPGYYRLEVTSDGLHLSGSPFSVQVSSNDSSTAGDADSPEKPKLLQQSNGLEDICRPIVDQVKAWEGIAAAQFGLEGGMDGWDSDSPDPESSEDKYLKAHPDVPVVDNLEDIWLVNKLQEERKAKQQQQERKQQLHHYKQAAAANNIKQQRGSISDFERRGGRTMLVPNSMEMKSFTETNCKAGDVQSFTNAHTSFG